MKFQILKKIFEEPQLKKLCVIKILMYLCGSYQYLQAIFCKKKVENI